MNHRGPDDSGTYIDGQVGFGFRRLSIIDLAGGHQPMSDPEETVWVVFNGEIYNYRELRRELKALGYSFRTESDTEVIVHGYKQWGLDVLNHLSGMFGLAIWDARRRKLAVARDAMGIKPVYYRISDESLLFASEVRAIQEADGRSIGVDPVALNLFLRYRYTPAPLTIFEGIAKLAPGTMLTTDDGGCSVSRWYKYKPVATAERPSVKTARNELSRIYRSAVERHLLSDVPVGLLLSGGMDSGLLLGLMNMYGSAWPAYTVGYGESYAGDELDAASETAKLLSASHVRVRIDRQRFESALPRIVSCLEEPIASSSIVPMYFVCERAREDVTVALIGQGPDELFGGYRRHFGVRYGSYWRSLPGPIRRAIALVARSSPRNEWIRRSIYSLDIPDRMKRYQHVFSLLPGETIDGLFRDGVLPEQAGDKVLECWTDLGALIQEADELNGFQYIELMSSLPDELLLYADKLSMAHSLELRVPYLDKELVEYAARLPADFKIRGRRSKWIHRQVCAEFLPQSVINRPKRGFAVDVVDSWFYGRLNSRLDELLLDPASLMFQFLRPEAVRRLLEDHRSKLSNNHKVLFSLVVFEEWLRSQATKV